MIAAQAKYTASYWFVPLAAAAPDLPTDRLVRWIARESGGNPADTPQGREVGIGQFNTTDGPVFGYSREQLHGTGAWSATATSNLITRALTADEESIQVQAMVAQARQSLSQAQAQLGSQSWSDADTWALCKMQHAIGHGGSLWLTGQASAAGHLTSWSDFKGYALGLSYASVPTSMQYLYPFTRFFLNAEYIAAGSGTTPDGSVTAPIPGGLVAVDLLSALVFLAVTVGIYFVTR